MKEAMRATDLNNFEDLDERWGIIRPRGIMIETFETPP